MIYILTVRFGDGASERRTFDSAHEALTEGKWYRGAFKGCKFKIDKYVLEKPLLDWNHNEREGGD